MESQSSAGATHALQTALQLETRLAALRDDGSNGGVDSLEMRRRDAAMSAKALSKAAAGETALDEFGAHSTLTGTQDGGRVCPTDVLVRFASFCHLSTSTPHFIIMAINGAQLKQLYKLRIPRFFCLSDLESAFSVRRGSENGVASEARDVRWATK